MGVNTNYQTVSGHELDLSSIGAEVLAFLNRLGEMGANPAVSHAHMIGLAYGPENPLLEQDIFPGRGAVTAKVLGTPPYRAMTDILFRKQLAERGIDPASLAVQFTLTPAQAAERLGVHVNAVRQAIEAGRLAGWMKGGRIFIDPRSLASFKLSPRGPQPQTAPADRASTEPLHVRVGTEEGRTLHLKAVGGIIPAPGNVRKFDRKIIEGTVSPWRQVGLFLGTRGKGRFMALEPAEEEAHIDFGPLHVRGKFRVAEKINNVKAAKEAWQAFEPA